LLIAGRQEIVLKHPEMEVYDVIFIEPLEKTNRQGLKGKWTLPARGHATSTKECVNLLMIIGSGQNPRVA
jgi:hypothetical protein